MIRSDGKYEMEINRSAGVAKCTFNNNFLLLNYNKATEAESYEKLCILYIPLRKHQHK